MRVDRLRQALDIEMIYRHFPLHPDTPKSGLTLEQLFAGRNIDLPAAKARMTQLMAAEGLPYGERTMTYNSRLAQELGKWADANGQSDEMHLALFQAYFVDNTNLANVEALMQIAEGVGLSKSEAERVLAGRTYRLEVDADWARARQLGVTAVPTFVMNGQGLVGAQGYDELEAFAMSAGATRRPP